MSHRRSNKTAGDVALPIIVSDQLQKLLCQHIRSLVSTLHDGIQPSQSQLGDALPSVRAFNLSLQCHALMSRVRQVNLVAVLAAHGRRWHLRQRLWRHDLMHQRLVEHARSSCLRHLNWWTGQPKLCRSREVVLVLMSYHAMERVKLDIWRLSYILLLASVNDRRSLQEIFKFLANCSATQFVG